MRDKLFKTEVYKEHKIKVYVDENPESPREWDNMGTMVCFHRRYNIGDENSFSDPEGFKEFWDENKNNIVVMPLYLYDHSGITISTGSFNDSWDSGQVGWIYVLYERIMEEYGVIDDESIQKTENVIRGEVKVYDQYLTGQVYGYMIEGGLCSDSCWGFYGYDTVMEEAKSMIDWSVERRKVELEEYSELGFGGYLILPEYPYESGEVM